MPRTHAIVSKPGVGVPSAAVQVSGVAASAVASAVDRIASSRRVPVGAAATAQIGSVTPVVARDFYLTAPTTLSASEGTNAVVTVTSSIAFQTDTRIDYTVAGVNGATSGVDYIAPASPLILPAGQTSVNLSIQILADAVVDPNEIVRISWTGVTAL